jgi:hypothetical protein
MAVPSRQRISKKNDLRENDFFFALTHEGKTHAKAATTPREKAVRDACYESVAALETCGKTVGHR